MCYKSSAITERDVLKGCLKDLNDAFVSIRANCIGGVPSQIASVRDSWIKELIKVEKEVADIEVKEQIDKVVANFKPMTDKELDEISRR